MQLITELIIRVLAEIFSGYFLLLIASVSWPFILTGIIYWLASVTVFAGISAITIFALSINPAAALLALFILFACFTVWKPMHF